MTVRKKPNESNPDPYVMARLMADYARGKVFRPIHLHHSGGVGNLEEAVHGYDQIAQAATGDQPLTEIRTERLLKIALVTMHILHQTGALEPRPAPKGLTPIRAKIMRFINAQRTRHHVSPTFREIAAHMGHKSCGPIAKHIERLKADGYLHRGAGARSLVPTDIGNTVR